MKKQEITIAGEALLKLAETLSKSEAYLAVLNSCHMHAAMQKDYYQVIIAWGATSVFEPTKNNLFTDFKQWSTGQEWKFGLLGYDLKNEIEKLATEGENFAQVPAIAFFKPKHVIALDTANKAMLYSDELTPLDIDRLLTQDMAFEPCFSQKPKVQNRTSKTEYLQKIQHIRQLIEEGEVYELNYCQEFYSHPAHLKNPFGLFSALQSHNPSPFSAFFKFNHHYLISSSPERFLTKRGQHMLSQPIKGTIKRAANQDEKQAIDELLHSEKDRAENVMIVDLVRNDLTKSSKTGSIQVDELFGIYTYPTVHQMISTVSSELLVGQDIIQAIAHCFPMGSMTGAPKIAAMQYIDTIEHAARGWYSGAFGYIDPQEDFDLNVVIRSYVYNANTDYLSVWAGGAITYDSDAEKEYEESLLKAKALLDRLQD